MARQQKQGLLVVLLLAGGWWLVYATGGTYTAATHAMYIAIVVASVAFGPWGGAFVGVVAGLLMAVTPVVVATGQLQSLWSLGFRTVFYVGIGVLIGLAVQPLKNQQREMQRLLIQSVSALTNAMSASHPHTAGHSLRVAEISSALGTALELDEQSLFILRTGSLLHDIGKLAVSADILDKPGRLSAEEYAAVKEHAAAGAKILQAFDYSRVAAIEDIVRHHHERLDGSGYPDALVGREISLFARVVAVADVYDALTSYRPYRSSVSHAEAIAELRHEVRAGRMDGDLVELLNEVIYQERRNQAMAVERAG